MDFIKKLDFKGFSLALVVYFLWVGFILIAVWGLARNEEVGNIRAKGGLYLLGVVFIFILSSLLFPQLWLEVLFEGFRA